MRSRPFYRWGKCACGYNMLIRLGPLALCILKAQQLTTKACIDSRMLSVASPVSRPPRNSPAHQLAVSRMPAFSVYLEGTRSHNEGRVSTPTCYVLLAPRVCTLVLFILSGGALSVASSLSLFLSPSFPPSLSYLAALFLPSFLLCGPINTHTTPHPSGPHTHTAPVVC